MSLSSLKPTLLTLKRAKPKGMNAVINEDDNVRNHLKDTLKSSHGLGKESTIQGMCEDAKDIINWLDELGVPFTRTPEGTIAQRKMVVPVTVVRVTVLIIRVLKYFILSMIPL